MTVQKPDLMDTPRDERLEIAERITSIRDELATLLTESYFCDHPGFEGRHTKARQRTREDFGYILEFLASSIAAGSADAFADFARWTQRILISRRVPEQVLADSLDRVADALGERLDDDEVLAVLQYARETLGSSAAESTDELGSDANLFVQAILNGNRRAAVNVVSEARRRAASIASVYVNVIQKAMYEVGRRWERNEITVADEHLATAVTQYVLANLYEQIEIPDQLRGRAVVTGIEGESHQLGANMVADMLEADGWDVRFLGANVPSTAVLAAIDAHDPDLLGISATMLLNASRVAELVASVRERASDRPRIVVGGAAFRMAPELAAEIGADAIAEDVVAAVTTVRELFAA